MSYRAFAKKKERRGEGESEEKIEMRAENSSG